MRSRLIVTLVQIPSAIAYADLAKMRFGYWTLSGAPVRQVIVDGRTIPSIDTTATEQLRDYVAKLPKRGIEFVVAKAQLPLRGPSAFGGILVGGSHFRQLSDAVSSFQNRTCSSTQQLRTSFEVNHVEVWTSM
jgi:hypothetical protein